MSIAWNSDSPPLAASFVEPILELQTDSPGARAHIPVRIRELHPPRRPTLVVEVVDEECHVPSGPGADRQAGPGRQHIVALQITRNKRDHLGYVEPGNVIAG